MSAPASRERIPTQPRVEDAEPTSGAIVRPGHPTEVAGRYRIVSRIGDGGMGVVYRAEHVLSKKKLAIKLLHPHLCQGKQAVERFKREVSAAAEIDHPGIVQVFDAGVDADGSFYMAMELLEGESLSHHMRREWPGTRRALEMVIELCEPLARAHDKGFIHRDLKPDNVFLAKDPETGVVRVKLLDFGLARDLGKKGTTESGVTFGTPEYMAPEQSMSAKNAGTQADVWSVGVMLYELLTGFHPFTGDTPNAIMVAAIKEPHTPIAERAPHVPAPICEVVEAALVKSVEARIQTAGALAEALHAAIDRVGVLDEQRPAMTHRMAEAAAAAEESDSLDLTGIPAADDAAIARVKAAQRGQRNLATEVAPAASAGGDAKRYAIIAGVVSVLVVIGLGAWAAAHPSGPEVTATSLATSVPTSVVAPVIVPDVIPDPPPTSVPSEALEAAPEAPAPTAATALEAATTDTPSETATEPPPATTVADAPRPRAPALTALTPEEAARARDCFSHNDFACAIDIYRHSRDPHDLGRVIDALQHLGRHREALTTMRDFVRRFPRAPETAAYRAQLAAAGM